MAELQFSTKGTFEVEIDGTKHVVRVPSLSESREYFVATQLKEGDEERTSWDQLEDSQEFLAKLGIPKDVSDRLPLEALAAIIERACAGKKQSAPMSS